MAEEKTLDAQQQSGVDISPKVERHIGQMVLTNIKLAAQVEMLAQENERLRTELEAARVQTG